MDKASGAGMSGDNSSASSVFLPEDIMINILLRLPTASCLARLRCVCRSWRILLSDTQFIYRFLFFQNSDDLKSLRILFTGGPRKESYVAYTVHYYLHSYDTLGLISAGDLPSVPSKTLPAYYQFCLTVVGCCDGIFCIADENPCAPSDLLLWNPATSETKLILPRTSCPLLPGLEMYDEVAGFGYDPETKDYKVVRILMMGIDEYYRDYPRPEPFTHAEVYSLRNDSWKKLNFDGDDDRENMFWCGSKYAVNQQRGILRNRKCYWFSGYGGECATRSFDMSREVFEYTLVANPPAINGWACSCSFMLKESFVAVFACRRDIHAPYQIWGLLKQGVADSWTKLFPITSLGLYRKPLEVWKDGAYICSRESEQRKDRTGHVYISCPESSLEEELHDLIEIRGRTRLSQALCYVPTQASLSHWE